MRRAIVAAFALTVLAACQPVTTELTEEQKAAIADTVSAVNAEFWSALEAAEFDRGMSYVYNSPEAVWGYAGVVDFGWDAIYARYSPMFETMASQTLTFTESRATVLTPDVVCINQIGSAIPTDTAGVVGPEENFAVLTVWVRRDGEWKVQFGHESVLIPEGQ